MKNSFLFKTSVEKRRGLKALIWSSHTVFVVFWIVVCWLA